MPENVVKIDRRRRSSTPKDQPPPELVWPIVIKLLHGPVRNRKNEQIHELAFRRPTGRDIRRYGNPVRITSDADLIVDEEKMTHMISALSNVYIPHIERLDAR